jgi:mono/diheme cytochrome c family protein
MKQFFVVGLLAVATAGAAMAQETPSAAAPAPWPTPPMRQIVDPATLTDPQLQRGHAIFLRECVHCHGEGRGMIGTSALGIKYQEADPALPPLLEERTDLTPELVTLFVRTGVGTMAQYRKTEISDAELADLAAYLSRPRP